MHTWSNKPTTWKVNGALCISVPFTWMLPDAIKMANAATCKVIMGGPAVLLMWEYVESKIAKNVHLQRTLDGIEPIVTHNPFATFTTRGCINSCAFCAVPKLEGTFRELPEFIPRPIICDNNFLAASEAHIKKTIDKLRNLPTIDFNQGLDCALFTKKRAEQLSQLKIPTIRFSFDHLKRENNVVTAIELAKKHFKTVSIYLLYGFFHTVDESVYMAELLRKLKVSIYPMRYQPLDTLHRNKFVCTEKGWDDFTLKAFQRCYFITKIPFAEFKNQISQINYTDMGFDL